MFNCGKISKDFLKFRQYLRNNNLSIKEQYLMEYFFEFHNIKFGYAYPKFEDMLNLFGTTCRNTISNIIKSLEDKGILKVDRECKNNRYYIIDIDKFLNGKGKKQEAPKELINEELISEDEKKVIDHTGFTLKQTRKLLIAAKNNAKKVIDAFLYAEDKKPDNIFGYTKWCVKNGKENEEYNKLKFNNFEAREYDYKDLEWKLLGWNENR